MPTDPWRSDVYVFPGVHNAGKFDIYSLVKMALETAAGSGDITIGIRKRPGGALTPGADSILVALIGIALLLIVFIWPAEEKPGISGHG